VSFRGVGGSYLEKKKLVTEALGRFIRAMTIASDPTEYRKEYLNKLSKLIARFTPQKKTSQFSSGMSGVMAMTLLQWSDDPSKTNVVEANLERLKQQVMTRYGACVFSNINETQAAELLSNVHGAPTKPEVIDTVRGFFAVPVTEEGQLKAVRSTGNQSLDDVVGDTAADIDSATYQVKAVTDQSGRKTGRYIATNIGFVPRGHKSFGRLVKSVIMGLKK
jgi:hypothetical protein